MRRQLPVIIVALVAVFVMFVKFVDLGEFSTKAVTQADQWSQVTYEFAFLLGAINFTRLHYNNVSKKRSKWIYSAIALIAMIGATLINMINGVDGVVSVFIANNIASGISGSIYALLGFYVCSAAYRSFKIRNIEAGILLVTAVILMLSQAPIGDAVFPGMSKIGEWILDVPNSAALRGIGLGAGIGGFAASIRVLLGLERSWTGN